MLTQPQITNGEGCAITCATIAVKHTITITSNAADILPLIFCHFLFIVLLFIVFPIYQIKFFILISFLTQKGKKDGRSEYKKHTPIALTYDREHREEDAQISPLF